MRITKPVLGLSAVTALTLSLAAPATAITFGEPDDGEHPFGGIMVALVEGDDGELEPGWRCSGTLVSPTHFLTAGHCTYGADAVEVWFDEEIDRDLSTYPVGGDDSVSGTPFTHPDYVDAAFYLNDLGMVVLDEKVEMEEYGLLPELGYFEDFFVKRGQNKQEFTAVGYGLQRSMPDQTGLTEAELERRQATLRIINQDAAFGEKKAGNSVLFTNNASGGGTCSGDSGGPIFVEGTTTVAAVTSFGLNQICAGTGGGYRVDTADDLDWLEEEFGLVSGQKW